MTLALAYALSHLVFLQEPAHLPLITGDIQDRTLESESAATAYVQAGSTSGPGSAPVLASVFRDDPMRFRRAMVSFHLAWLTDGEGRRGPVWFARLRSADHKSVETRYADGRTCAALNDSLQLMEHLETPVVDIIGVPRGEPPPSRLNRGSDGMTFTVKLIGEFRSTRGYGDLTLSGDQSSPIAALARVIDTGMADCWTPRMPT